MTIFDPHRTQPVVYEGQVLDDAFGAFILVHGRGGSAEGILGLGRSLGNRHTTLIAPESASHSWYPNSFLAPLADNEPWLSSALAKIGSCVNECIAAGLTTENIVFAGFSQGACLATEFVARNPARYGALLAFTGGLIGPIGMDMRHSGDLLKTPILLSSGDPDPHVPWQRVEETGRVLSDMGGVVSKLRHQRRPHTILPSEVETARSILAENLFAISSPTTSGQASLL